MEAASFNDQLCGDTLTAEIEMDTATSEIIDSRVHAAVISPIARLDFNGFNARLESETNEKWSLFQEAARISQSFLNEDTEGTEDTGFLAKYSSHRAFVWVVDRPSSTKVRRRSAPQGQEIR